jgi:hypothetical protein
MSSGQATSTGSFGGSHASAGGGSMGGGAMGGSAGGGSHGSAGGHH